LEWGGGVTRGGTPFSRDGLKWKNFLRANVAVASVIWEGDTTEEGKK